MAIRNKGKKIVIKHSKDDANSSEPIIRDSDPVSDEIIYKLETAGIHLAAKTSYAKLKNHSINDELLIASSRSTSIPQGAFRIDRPKTKGHIGDLYFIAVEDIGVNRVKDFWRDDYIVLGSENKGIDADVLSFTVESTKGKKFNKYFLLIGENIYSIVEKFNRPREKKAAINFSKMVYAEDESLNKLLSVLRSLDFKQRVTSYEGLLSEFQEDVIPLPKSQSLPAGCLRFKTIGARDRSAYLSFKASGRLLNEAEHGKNKFIVVPISKHFRYFMLVDNIPHELVLGPITNRNQAKRKNASGFLPMEPSLGTELLEIIRAKLAKSGLKWSPEQYQNYEQFLQSCKMETSDFRVHTDLKKAPEGCFEFNKETKLDQNVYGRLAVYKDKMPNQPANAHVLLKEHEHDMFLKISVRGNQYYFIVHESIPYEICRERSLPGTVHYRALQDDNGASDPLPENIKVLLSKYSLDHLSYKKFKELFNIQEQLTILQKPKGGLPKSAFKVTAHKAPKNNAYFVLNGEFIKLDDYPGYLILYFDKTKIPKLTSDHYFLLFNDELIEIKTKGTHNVSRSRQELKKEVTDVEDDVQEVQVCEKVKPSQSVSDLSTKRISQRIAKRKMVLEESSSSEESEEEQLVASNDSDDDYVPKRRAKANSTVKVESKKQPLSTVLDDYDMTEFSGLIENGNQSPIFEQFASTDDLYSEDELESPNYDDLGDDIPVIDLTTLLQNEASEERVRVKQELLSDDALTVDNLPVVKREAKSFLASLGFFATRNTDYYDDPDLSPSPLVVNQIIKRG